MISIIVFDVSKTSNSFLSKDYVKNVSRPNV